MNMGPAVYEKVKFGVLPKLELAKNLRLSHQMAVNMTAKCI